MLTSDSVPLLFPFLVSKICLVRDIYFLKCITGIIELGIVPPASKKAEMDNNFTLATEDFKSVERREKYRTEQN